MKKKIASLVMTALMASTVAACSPSTTSTTAAGTAAGTTTAAAAVEDPKTEITVQAEQTWVPYYETAIAALKAKFPDSTVKIVEVGAFDNINTIDSTDVNNADVPDVFAIPADRVPSMVSKEALAAIPAEEMAAAIGGYTNFTDIGSILKDGEDYLAFPMNIETLIAFVNPNNAKEQNIDLTKPWEFADQKNLELTVKAFDAWFGVSFTNSVGLELLGKKDDGTFFSDMTKNWADLEPAKQGVITALFNYWKKVYADAPTLWDEQAADGKIAEMFKDGGEVVYKIDGPWGTPDLLKAVPALDVMPLSQITVNGAPLKHWQGLWGLAVNSRNEGDQAKMTLSEEFIKELMNPANAEAFFTTTGKIMPNVSVEDYNATGLTEIQKKTISAVIESFKTSEKRPLFNEWGGVWDTWKNALLSWNNSKPATAEEAYKALQDSFTAMMGNIGQ